MGIWSFRTGALAKREESLIVDVTQYFVLKKDRSVVVHFLASGGLPMSTVLLLTAAGIAQTLVGILFVAAMPLFFARILWHARTHRLTVPVWFWNCGWLAWCGIILTAFVWPIGLALWIGCGTALFFGERRLVLKSRQTQQA